MKKKIQGEEISKIYREIEKKKQRSKKKIQGENNIRNMWQTRKNGEEK